ncbi:MAG: lysophospholipid acyltransferase family protein [Tannerellaceae bacterium]|jgi:putative hemolysin|nr:lysophospholipid acyltransferase family protein [Tannerellaceae bacterium]
MKKSVVVDIRDLQEATPFFKSRFGLFLGKLLIKWLGIEKVNKVYANSCHLRGAELTTSLLKDPLINIKYEIHHAEIVDHLPEGAFVTVSNHPVGSLDGIILIDMFASRRPDFRVMVNGILTKISAMEDQFISVTPDSGNQVASTQNVNGIRASLACIKEGHPMGFFPAGAISFYSKKEKKVRDLSWSHNVIRLIRKANVAVYPVYFDCLNSPFFYWLGRVSWKIRVLRIPVEVFNKRGKTLHVYIGEPIPPEVIQEITDDEQLADFLYQETYRAKK